MKSRVKPDEVNSTRASWMHCRITETGHWAQLTRSRFQTFLALVAVGLSGCGEIIHSHHATRAEAQDTVDRGWIPSVLPGSAVDIRVSYDLDTNVGHGTFRFGASDAEEFRAALNPVPSDQPLRAHQVSRSEFERRGYQFYRHDDFDLAVDWDRRVGEFWLVYTQ